MCKGADQFVVVVVIIIIIVITKFFFFVLPIYSNSLNLFTCSLFTYTAYKSFMCKIFLSDLQTQHL